MPTASHENLDDLIRGSRKRKRLLRRWKIGFVSLFCIAAVVLVTWSVYLRNQGGRSVEDLPASEPVELVLSDALGVKSVSVSKKITAREEEVPEVPGDELFPAGAAAGLVRQFVEASSPLERSSLCRGWGTEEKEVWPDVHKWSGNGLLVRGIRVITDPGSQASGIAQRWFQVDLPRSTRLYIPVVPTKDGLRIDIEAMAGAYTHDMEKFLEGRSAETQVDIRVLVQWGDYYNYEFSEEKWRCVRLNNPNWEGRILYGYVERGLKVEAELEELVPSEQGVSRRRGEVRASKLTLRLARPEGGNGRGSGSQAEVLSLVRAGWVEREG